MLSHEKLIERTIDPSASPADRSVAAPATLPDDARSRQGRGGRAPMGGRDRLAPAHYICPSPFTI